MQLNRSYMPLTSMGLAMAIVERGYPEQEHLEMYPQRITAFRTRSFSDWMESLKVLGTWGNWVRKQDGVAVECMES